MREYFLLQLRMLNRKFKDAGIKPPVLGFILLIIAFVAFSFLLFRKSENAAKYLYIFTALAAAARLAEARRNDFLKLCFSNTNYKKIRAAENLIIVFPFFIFLVYKQLFLFAFILTILAVLLVFVQYSKSFTFTIPTPFYKKPFEFTVGFRNSFYMFFIFYAIAAIAAFAGNFNLGIFAMLFIFLITLNYYIKLENEYYIWIYKQTAKQFLFEKIKVALLHSSFLILPVFIVLEISFYEKTVLILAFLLIGYLFLIYMVVAKYSVCPNDISLFQFICLAIVFSFPPLIIILMPYFFYQSKNRLNNLLK